MSISAIDLALLFMALSVLLLVGSGFKPPEEPFRPNTPGKAKSAHALPSVRTRC